MKKVMMVIVLSVMVTALAFAQHIESYAEQNAAKENVTLPSFPICTVKGDQAFGQIAYNSNDREYLVVWQDFRSINETIGLNARGLVYGQIVSPTGELLGPEIPISTDHPEIMRILPVDTYNPVTNEYLVVYLKDWDVCGRFLKNDGSLRSDEFVIRTGPEHQNHPSVIYNPKHNNFLVVWNDSRTGKNENDIYGVFINNDGGKDGEEFVICDVPKDQYYPAIVYNPKGDEFMVVYEDFRDCTTDPCYNDISSLFARRVSTTGELLGDEIVVGKDGYDKRQQNFCYNPNLNEYMIVWNDKRNETDPSKQNKDIYARRMKNDGTMVGGDFPVCTAPNDQGYCTVAYDPTEHKYLMVWNDFRDQKQADIKVLLEGSIGILGGNVIYDPGTVYGMWYDDNATPAGAEFILCEESKGTQMLALARYNTIAGTYGQYFIVWSDMRTEANKRNIYGKFIEKETCPATAMLGDGASLNLLRIFRDTVLSCSPRGKKYIDLYYQNAAEVTSLINADAGLRQAATALLTELLPSVQSMIQGKQLYMPQNKEKKVTALLNALASKASPDLKVALEMVSGDIQLLQ
jgi:hypothetical protein